MLIFIVPILFLCLTMPIYAEKVPGKMAPFTIIEFDENLNIKIIYPGDPTFKAATPRPYEKLDLGKMTEKQREEYFEEKRIFEEAKEFAKTAPVTRVEIIPEPFMRIKYDGEGFVREIIDPEEPEKVPGRMNPNAIIEFDENLKIQVINPGDPSLRKTAERPYEKLDLGKMTEKEREEYFEEEKIFEEAREFAENGPVTRVEIIPEPFMRIIYDAEGFVDEIIYPVGSSHRYRPLKKGTTSPIGTYTWGDHDNTLVVKEEHVTGIGRFTVFTDEIGENDNKLEKGDCATRGDYDNPKHGQEIATRKLNDDLSNTECTHTFYKRDNGALPDAILDIWKDGVEYLDEKYSSTLSFMGRYFYYK